MGWIAPKKYKEKILKLKLVHAISSSAVTQEAVANFLKNGRYENHLRISIAPGRMFSLQDQFENCMRLSFGLPWSEDIRHKLKVLGGLVKQIDCK